MDILSKLRKKNGSGPLTTVQRKTAVLTKHGVENPQPQNMNRNVMLSQIETFNRSKLQPLQPSQRYIISPHKDVRNLVANTVGMSAWGVERGLPPIRPVFKDENQRKSFAKSVQKQISNFGPVNDQTKHRMTALTQLSEWSTPQSAMHDFKGINTKRQQPIVYVQGHGQYGDKHIYSDSHEKVSASHIGQLLHDKGLPKLSEVRANSCYSGTEHELHDKMPDINKHFSEQSLEFHHAGNWGNTFAGALQEKLKSFGGRKNRVAGYMGPTGQGAEPVKSIGLGGVVQKRQGVATDIATNIGTPAQGIDPHKRGQMKRIDPSYKG